MKKIIPFPGDFPLSQAIIHDERYTMEISWLIWMNPETKKLEDGISWQTHQVMKNILSTLESAGWNMSNIIKTRIFLVDMKDYTKMNEIYASYFTDECPTRFALEVSALPAGALIEIECTAAWNTINS